MESTKKTTPPGTHYEGRSSPANATSSRRRAKKHVARVCPISPASIDTRFVQIGLVQLSQSVKTTNSMSHTYTHKPTDKLNTPCTHPGTSREVKEATRPHTCSRPCAFKEKKNRQKTRKNNPPHRKHTTKSTAAWRPRPSRDGARRNASHALAQTRPLP